ncbi:hypothetical protein Hamer_G012274 [Homarus americanus]|uniref:Uncharacterized protein n=1 Tax=Homarus americanus TaxID=6706 RepID=A0A8J5KFM0_HOMAM|nr:hypothetical protein Hamer_G012274 [Homarus americanus]
MESKATWWRQAAAWVLVVAVFRCECRVLGVTAGIITVPFLPCSRVCEVRFPDGVCRVSISCLLALNNKRHNNNQRAKIIVVPCWGQCMVETDSSKCVLDYACLYKVYPRFDNFTKIR